MSLQKLNQKKDREYKALQISLNNEIDEQAERAVKRRKEANDKVVASLKTKMKKKDASRRRKIAMARECGKMIAKGQTPPSTNAPKDQDTTEAPEDTEDEETETETIDVVNVERFRKNCYKIQVFWHNAKFQETWHPRTIIEDFPEIVWEHACKNRAPWKEEWKDYIKRLVRKLHPDMELVDHSD